MKILAFAGSNSSVSINKKLIVHTASYFLEDEVKILDLNDYEMPIYSHDRELKTGIPQLAHDFAKKIDESDFLIISLAEHNGNYSVAFKNIFDWVSRIKERPVFGNKPMLLMATSNGGRGGAGVLDIAKKRMPYSGGNVLETFSLPGFSKNFNILTGVINEDLKKELETKIQSIKNNLKQVKNGNN
ncbi:MAG TPA: NAD(P)H-dependent oxidoreductase [Bacteroidia bacterium]|nr:NAD(P)H-dependent oxidoreductase [Bacteroidia bacterium]